MKNHKSRILIALLAAAGVFSFAEQSAAAAFDCARAGTAVEKTICSDPALSALDDQLAASYRRSLVADPRLKEQQLKWLSEVRNNCPDAKCLETAYRQRIADLKDGAGREAQGAAEPAGTPPAKTGTDGNPLALFMDVKSFYGQPEQANESLWSNPNGELFRKRVVDWTEQDFRLLEHKLREQLEIERDEAAVRQEKVRQMGFQAKPVEDDRDYQYRREVLEKILAAIPKYMYLAAQTRDAEAQARAAREREAQKQQELEADRERQRVADAERRDLEARRRQEEASDSRNMLIFYAVLAAIIGGWVWHKFIRLRCPKCKSTRVDTLDVTEIDRWRGTKKVTESNTRGSKTRYVSATYVKNQYQYQCRDCNKEWLGVKKEEL